MANRGAVTTGNDIGSAIYGSSAVTNATYLTDLNPLSNGKDPYVSVTSDTSVFNIWQKLFITDNFYDTRWEEQYVTQGQGTTNYTIQGNTMGWVRTDEMVLNVPLTLAFTTGATAKGVTSDEAFGTQYPQDPADFTSYLDGMRRYAAILGWTQQVIDTTPPFTLATYYYPGMNISLMPNIMAGLYPDWALFQIFQQIQLYGANNNQYIGKQPSFPVNGMRNTAYDNKYDQDTASIAGLWGVPVSHMSTDLNVATGNKPTLIGPYSGGFSMGNYAGASDAVSDAFKKAFSKVLLSTSTYNGGTQSGPSGTAPDSLYYTFTNNVTLPLPLGLISNFFKHQQYLPVGFKYKFDFNLANQGNPVCVWSTDYPNGSYANTIKQAQNGFCNANLNQAGTFKLVYPQSTLRQPTQLSINEKWIKFPLVYNYETNETYTISSNNSSNPYSVNIAISQQRPTQISLAILDTVTVFPPTATGNAQVQNALGNKVGSTLTTQIFIQQIIINIGGRTYLQYRNTGNETLMNNIPNPYEAILQGHQKAAYPSYSQIAVNNPSVGTFEQPNGGDRLIFTIAPGNFADTGSIPSDLGAHIIQMQILTNLALGPNKMIEITKKLPSQLALDTSQNATLIEWPAVKSNNGFAINNVVNSA